MTKVFQDYSNYYDLLNTGKDYAREAEYVSSLAQCYGTAGQLTQVLNLGCGTGCHDLHLARHGYHVTGVDRSEAMLAIAKRRTTGDDVHPKPVYRIGDITRLALPHSFDLGLALFHVMSYQTSNAELVAAIKSVAAHLRPGGLFIFDFWYGPAVLHDKPTVRIKRVENDELKLLRLTEPTLQENANTVTVNFEVIISDKKTGSTQTLHESHLMRYFFLPEIMHLLEDADLSFITAEEWLTGQPPALTTWNVCCVARKNMA